MASNRFDLEQDILACWGVVEDIRLLYDNYDQLTDAERRVLLLSLISLYELKFQKTFSTFEAGLEKPKE